MCGRYFTYYDVDSRSGVCRSSQKLMIRPCIVTAIVVCLKSINFYGSPIGLSLVLGSRVSLS